MKSELVQEWLTRCIGIEGGYWDDPVGGPTKWGISQRAYPHLNIADLTVEQASAIYIIDYITPLQIDKYPVGVGYQLFDFGVNSGPKTATKQLQEAVGVKADGIIGPISLAAIRRHTDSHLVMLVLAERLEYMADCDNFRENARGWVRRIAKDLRYGAKDTD